MTNSINSQHLAVKFNFNQPKPISTILYDTLKDAILAGMMPLGERINEHHLATSLNISRTPVRKALKQLTTDGLTEYLPNRGTVIKSISVTKVQEIFSIRQALEKLIYTSFIAQYSANDLLTLTRFRHHMISHENMNQVPNLLRDFHNFNQKIIRTSNLTTVASMLADLDTYFKNFRNYSLATQNRRRLATYEHLFIINCIQSQDLVSLQTAVYKHIQDSEEAALRKFAVIANASGVTRYQSRQTKLDQPLFCDGTQCAAKHALERLLR